MCHFRQHWRAMVETHTPKKNLEDLQDDLQKVRELLHRHRLVASLVNHQPQQPAPESLAHKQNESELRNKLERMHPADIACLLEALPPDERVNLWDLVRVERDGEILLEVTETVRETLIQSMKPDELLSAAGQLDTDELADLAPDLPQGVIQDVLQGLSLKKREQLRAAMSYPEDTVGALMDFEMVTVRDDVRLETVTRYLRRFNDLPDHTNQIFVVDREESLKGVLPLARLITGDLDKPVAEVMVSDVITLYTDDKAQRAAQAFERYGLVSAAVVNEEGKLVGRVTVDRVVDFIRNRSASELLGARGLKKSEDIFASVWASVRNRGSWLAINLITALIASRVISHFEGSIVKLVALAALMPIVTGIGGNAGNQTMTLMVRAFALGQIRIDQAKKLFAKELLVALANGLIWGGILGLLAAGLYSNIALGMVMTLAMTLNLLLAAIMGVLIPAAMVHFGRDPRSGSSALITACTDSGGFFIFLGLATLILL